jgi:hypothetical protein
LDHGGNKRLTTPVGKEIPDKLWLLSSSKPKAAIA